MTVPATKERHGFDYDDFDHTYRTTIVISSGFIDQALAGVELSGSFQLVPVGESECSIHFTRQNDSVAETARMIVAWDQAHKGEIPLALAPIVWNLRSALDDAKEMTSA